MSNSIIVIFPYKYQDMWVFDDRKVGLIQEPFVSRMPQIIDLLVAEIENADQGFKLLASNTPFPEFQIKMTWLNEEYKGNWYYWKEADKKGWLCPALLKYFDKPPQELFCKAEQINR